jgi:hypothetical protein
MIRDLRNYWLRRVVPAALLMIRAGRFPAFMKGLKKWLQASLTLWAISQRTLHPSALPSSRSCSFLPRSSGRVV